MTKKEIKKLILVDGSSYLFRAYHAMPPLTNAQNMPTGAMYGVVNMLKKLVASEEPDLVGVVFDAKGKNFRHEIYSEYKANRPAMPEELAVQIQPLHNIIRALGFPLIMIEGVEADDVIGTLAVEASKQNMQVLISTGDKDMAQLVEPNVTLINTMTGKYMDEDGVIEKFGVRADQMIDYLALVGDSSDNIPGVTKVGPKTAQKWLTAYDSIDNLLDHASEIKGKIGENLRSHVAFIPTGKNLVTIRTNVDVKVQLNDLSIKAIDKPALEKLYAEMNFKTWLRDLEHFEAAPKFEKKYDIVTTKEQLNKWIEKINASKLLAFDTETTGLNPHMADLVGVSFSVKPGEAAYIPLGHDYDDCPEQLEKSFVLNKLKPILSNSDIKKVGQNIKYDMHVMSKEALTISPINYDTMIASYCFNSTQTRHDMDSLAKFYLGLDTIHYEDVAGKGAKQITFDQVAIETAGPYAAEDADITLRLHQNLQAELKGNEKLQALYENIEMPLVEVLFHMEQSGVCIDKDMLEKQSVDIAARLAILEKEVYAMAGEEFNLGSPKQLQEILFVKLEMPALHKTPKGAPSTSEAALQELSESYELPALILEHRSLSKLKSTYTDKLPLLINPNTQRIHTSYHQAVTATGRLSSSDPNLQNIPIRTEEGRKIRQAFIATTGKKIISADYSQIELRIMAHLSQDKGLLTAFIDNQDIHKFTASEVFATPLDEVTAEQRRSAKAINFGLIYGMSVFGLAKQLDVDQAAAKAYMEMYFKRYPGVKTYMENIRETAFEQGYVETLFGRRLYLPEIRSKQVPRRKAAERTAINAPMQGTAADLIKLAMIKIFEEIKDRKDIVMLMQVHDELIFEVDESVVEEAKMLIKLNMENCMALSVPLLVDVGAGDNWQQAH
tara:strand:- start:123925 stop:126609 length:2685 start_codon:yes stop_codon:yes gene_type:complete